MTNQKILFCKRASSLCFWLTGHFQQNIKRAKLWKIHLLRFKKRKSNQKKMPKHSEDTWEIFVSFYLIRNNQCTLKKENSAKQGSGLNPKQQSYIVHFMVLSDKKKSLHHSHILFLIIITKFYCIDDECKNEGFSLSLKQIMR